MHFQRFSVYYLPPPGPLADFGASWLGWDARQGLTVAQPELGIDLAALTAAPHRYGFHATLKAPFRATHGTDPAPLAAGLHEIAGGLAPVALSDGLVLRHDPGFVALVPARESPALCDLESALVRGMDRFRAPLSAAERARRHPETLTPFQRQQLDQWGYPWIFGDFRFHMTLTGPVNDPLPILAALEPLLPDGLDRDLVIDRVALMGEDAKGRFHLIDEAPLGD